jgi:quercetin dioxygenase-like cupin family protein
MKEEIRMRAFRRTALALLAVSLGSTCAAAQQGLAKPNLVVREVVGNMPTGARQEVRVFTAHFAPGDKTVYHTHRFPVAVYVVEGAFTLEMEGHPTKVVKAGEAMVEPPKVKMTGYNRSTTAPTKVVIFYVSDPDTPFLDLVK